MKNNNLERCKDALNEIWRLNRVHVSKEMSLAYRILKKYYTNLKIFGYKTGHKCNGWIVPPSWDVTKGLLKDSKGKTIADWKKNKLSLWSYSTSFKGKITKEKLKNKILSNPKKPDATLFHFRNQYNFWKKEWGFSLPYKIYKKLKKENFYVDIKTSFNKGKLEMAEDVHHGKFSDSILFVGHFDHPQMCLDGLVGCLAGHELLKRIKNKKTKLTYRMLSTVEIIGSVFYAKYHSKKNKVREAMFISAPGAPQNIGYQHTFSKNNQIDQITKHVLKNLDLNFKTFDFRKGPIGNDEIAYDVNGVNIPCGSLMRCPFNSYHTDLDKPSGISWKNFQESLLVLEEIIHIFENNSIIHGNFKGLPRLSSPKLNLYLSLDSVSGTSGNSKSFNTDLLINIPEETKNLLKKNTHKFNYLMNCLPNMCGGNKTILDVANHADLPFRFVENYINLWIKKNLLKKFWKHPFK
jgi:aminopeptidase-like protein